MIDESAAESRMGVGVPDVVVVREELRVVGRILWGQQALYAGRP